MEQISKIFVASEASKDTYVTDYRANMFQYRCNLTSSCIKSRIRHEKFRQLLNAGRLTVTIQFLNFNLKRISDKIAEIRWFTAGANL